MTLLQITDNLERIALTQPNINSVGEGNVYDFNNDNPNLKYGVFFITQTTHIEYEEYDRYGLTLFVIDRLEDDLESNRLRVQSHAKQVLGNIITLFCNSFDVDFPEITYTPFTQKFVNLTAGVYANIFIDVYKDTLCEDGTAPVWEKLGILQNKTVNVTENGEMVVSPDAGYDGLKTVNLNVNVVDEDCYERGFEDGVESGKTYQKSLLSSTALTENGTYTSENGYSAITVNVENNYTHITASVNGEYGVPQGYDAITAVTVNVAGSDSGTQQFFITLVTDNDVPVTGVSFTVSYADIENTYVYNGETMTVAIYPGVDYEIEFGDFTHYITPNTISGTSRYGDVKEITAVYRWLSNCYVDPESVSFEATGGSATIDIVADGAWTATSTGDWYVQSTTTGTGDGTISIAAVENNTGEMLEGCVNTEFYDGTTGTTYVSQKPVVYLDVDAEYILFEHSGSSYHLAVSSNTEYTITTPDWISYEYVDNLLVLTATDIGNTEGRHGYVVFTYDTFEKAISVNQVNPDYVLLVSSAGMASTEYLTNNTLSSETVLTLENGEIYVGSDCEHVAAMCGYHAADLTSLMFDIPTTSLNIGDCAFGYANIGICVIPKNVTFHESAFNRTNISNLWLNSNIPDGTFQLYKNTTTKKNWFRGDSHLKCNAGYTRIGPDVTYVGKTAFAKENAVNNYLFNSFGRLDLYGKPNFAYHNYTTQTKYSPYYNGNVVETFYTSVGRTIHVSSDLKFDFSYNMRYGVPEQIEDIVITDYIREKFV